MPARRVRSGAIWAGAALSALGHAALVALALVAPPWLRAHRDRPMPVVAVALVTPAAFEAALAALTAVPEAVPESEPESKSAPVAAPASQPAVGVPGPMAPPAEAPPAPLPTLAPSFDPEAPLGLDLGPRPEVADLPAHRPRARAGIPAAPAGELAAVKPAVAAAAFEAAVRAAVAEQVPDRAGGPGTVRLGLIVNREGRLLAARLLATSGSAALDRVATEAARRALLPEMPEAMPGQRTMVTVDVAFGAE